MTTEQNVIAFHNAFGHPARDTPQTLTREEALLALKLIEEEFLELVEAMFPTFDMTDREPDLTVTEELEEYPGYYPYKPDLVEIADAVGDLDYVVNGAGIRHGLDMRQLGAAIHKSNMSKLGADGKPLYHEDGPKKGKIRKGPGFVEPDLSAVIP